MKLLLALALAAQNAPRPHLEQIELLPVAPGVNRIPALAPDGRDGLIVRGWRDNGNAHGFGVFMVLLPERPGGPADQVATFMLEEERTTITDSPHTDEDYVRSVRFARATLDGHRQTIVLVATRGLADSIPSPSRTVIQILALDHRSVDEPLGPLDFFREAARFETTRLYCNADSALLSELRVPARPGTPDSPDGCT